MKFGIMAPHLMGPVDDGDYAIRFAQLAEELGFESIWVWEHVVLGVECRSSYPYTPSGRPHFGAEVPLADPLIWLAYVASATRSIRLATGILILPQRNPVVLAKAAASLDRLSGGRLLLGTGVGWLREEAEAIGTPFEDRGRRASEWIEVMRCLWREPVSSFHGAYHDFQDMVSLPKPAQRAGVPIIVGGHSRAAARRAGRLGDGFYPMGVDLEQLETLLSEVREAAREAGRDPAAIEITMGGAFDAESIERHARAGVSRLVLYPPAGDLDALRDALEPFARDVMARFV
jgi:probable F420-dependent oxidoreductase